jgi:hypothetical protein
MLVGGGGMMASVEQLIEKLYFVARELESNEEEKPFRFLIPCFSAETRLIMEEAFLRNFQERFGIAGQHNHVQLRQSNNTMTHFRIQDKGIEVVLVEIP